MDFRCPNCDHSIVIGVIPPKFCEQCGHPVKLEESTAPIPEDATIAPQTPRRNPDEFTDPDDRVGNEGRLIGRYVLQKQLGSGGMGIVYQAVEQETGREVALKLLSAGLTSDEETVDRFIREARLAAQISHPRTTFVYEAGQHEGRPFIAMELMPGQTLQDLLDRDQGFPVAQAVDHVLDVIDGLSAAHKLNVIHRDVKPSNCFIATDGRIKVGDFGLSKSLVTDVELTRTGTFMGTPSFAAPEQIRGAQVDQRTDIYAVGATLFCLIANRPPFAGDAMSVTAQIISDPPPGLKSIAPSVPKDLERIIAKTLCKEPEARYSNLQELRKALLPFSSRATTLTQIGRRSAAYMIDYIIVSIVVQLIGTLFVVSSGTLGSIATGQDERIAWIQFCTGLLSWLLTFMYFACGEGFLGYTIGKKILGLRVVNTDGETPGIGRALLRSFIVPSAFAIPIGAALIRFQFQGDNADVFDAVSLMTVWLTARAVELLPVLICLLTMRHSNGLRGLHGMLSGTRVIRIGMEKRLELSDLPSLKIFDLDKNQPIRIGPYIANGLISGNANCTVYLAHDQALDREILIYQWSDHANSETIDRNVSRPGRARWIQGGINEKGRWEAFEFIGGLPFEMVAELPKIFTWENTRNAIHDLLAELDISLQEGSLPQNLTIDQFFVDQDGHGKLLGVSLPNRDASGEERAFEETIDDRCGMDEPVESMPPNTAACRVINRVFDLVLEKQVIPNSVRRLLESFKSQIKSPDTIARFADRLEDSNQKLPKLSWDSRLGVFAVTMGGELTVLTGLIFFAVFVWVSVLGYFPLWKPFSLISLFACGFFAIGCTMKSSPVFRFMKIDIQHVKGGHASRVQCGLRNMIAWLPILIGIVGMAMTSFVGFEGIKLQKQLDAELKSGVGEFGNRSRKEDDANSNSESSPDKTQDDGTKSPGKDKSRKATDAPRDSKSKVDPSVQKEGDKSKEKVNGPSSTLSKDLKKQRREQALHPDIQTYPTQMIIFFLLTILAFLISIVFAVFSIVSPTRGFQDLICRTRLVPE